MRRIQTLAACLLAVLAVNCARKPEFKPAKDDLLAGLQGRKKKLNDKGVLAEVAVAESRDLQVAINKAELEARAKLGRAIESKASSLQKKFQEEAGGELSDHFSQTVKSLSDQVLQGTTLVETPFERDGEGNYRVYGLMVVDTEAYGKALAGRLEADKAMRDRWRASRAYKDLNDEIAAYQEWKRREAAPPAAGGL